MSWRSWNKPMRLGAVLLALACTCGGLLPGCGGNPLEGENYEPVYIVGTELLEPPAVPRSKVYKPEFRFDLQTADDEAIDIVGFFLTVSVSSPQRLQVRLGDRATQVATSLVRVVLSPANNSVGRQRLREDAPGVADLLQAETPVFQVEQEDPLSGGLEHRLEVLVPRAILSANVRLEVFTSPAADGSLIGADWIELVQEYFYMAAIGDSVMWGNGLLEEDKFHTIVADEIEPGGAGFGGGCRLGRPALQPAELVHQR